MSEEKKKVKLVKFDSECRSYYPRPHKMEVGQTVTREGCSRQYASMLKANMRLGMENGMEFSTNLDKVTREFTIRRDK